MTGRELIIYILSNNLEDEEVIKDGRIIGYMSDMELAAVSNYGPATIRTYIATGSIVGHKLGDSYYCPKDVKILKDPMLK